MLRVLSQAEVCARLGGIDPSTLWSWYTSGHFPMPIELGIPGGIRTKIGWREDEVDAWIESRPRVGEPPVEMVPKHIAIADAQDFCETIQSLMQKIADGVTEEQRAWAKAHLDCCSEPLVGGVVLGLEDTIEKTPELREKYAIERRPGAFRFCEIKS